ncbi:mediator of RNA polymerase ii transcription subunit 31 [Plakobranchus ocellatus]|uniref:Mediator of RNA polymerase II transcription subunit 31 n=1 Tax=Plakobranchus ocellatus TaxID=259542 RepID=A0AAV4CLE3_9GAST|nr:mediator of RNA polymerase ii transcription subunit 31 [Plakobranchus ocellatus]
MDRKEKRFETEEQARTRFQVELEFVQCLANPNYLNYVSSIKLKNIGSSSSVSKGCRELSGWHTSLRCVENSVCGVEPCHGHSSLMESLKV